jgi:hypothetical protein
MAALRYNDICDIAADAVRCIDARLYGRGLQLEALTGEALRRTLEGVLGLAEVEILDNEGTPLDPNEQHRLEVA